MVWGLFQKEMEAEKNKNINGSPDNPHSTNPIYFLSPQSI